jgi:hypothetical protein
MPRYKMLILSRPAEGQDARFNDWYQQVHLDEVLALKGFKAAQRFRLARNLGERQAQPYAAIYEIETEDLDGVLQELYREAGGAGMVIDASLDRASIYAAVYEPLGTARRRKRTARRAPATRH